MRGAAPHSTQIAIPRQRPSIKPRGQKAAPAGGNNPFSNTQIPRFNERYVNSKRMYSRIFIPVPPPLPIQEYIVSVLDRFDALCNDLTIGLPAEIELRKKQYEYYREKLLSFPQNE